MWDLVTQPLLSSLILGFFLGCIHAFDIDHIVAVSVMSSGEKNWQRCMGYSSRWALGHGIVLLSLGILAYTMGISLPTSVSLAAEKLIGLLLIVFGGVLIYQIVQHHGIQNLIRLRKKKQGTPFAVGIIHGMAGNAPVLAMLPALSQPSLLSAVSYMLFFSIGLLTSMVLFGLCLGKIQLWFGKKHEYYLNLSASVVGLSSLTVGIVWLIPY
ncbi:MAG: hypothetical protein KUG82_13245 [Pseudomonadales bacterium]|nr:hypothetical protein [Pseudomonadales bacterium]